EPRPGIRTARSTACSAAHDAVRGATEPTPKHSRLRMLKCWLISFSARTETDNGGTEEDRTPDLLRARQALSQLSYGPDADSECARWWVWVDLNHRPHPYQGCALTNCATDHATGLSVQAIRVGASVIHREPLSLLVSFC